MGKFPLKNTQQSIDDSKRATTAAQTAGLLNAQSVHLDVLEVGISRSEYSADDTVRCLPSSRLNGLLMPSHLSFSDLFGGS